MIAELADGTQLRSRCLVGCDGSRSTVRSLLGVGFPAGCQSGSALPSVEVAAFVAILLAAGGNVREVSKRAGHYNVAFILVASPCSGRGFKHSAAIGEAIAQRLLDETSAVDLNPLSLLRFGGPARSGHAEA